MSGKRSEGVFGLEARGTNLKTEVLAGITTFMTMAYILAVNPNILSAAGMDRGAVFTATALAAFVGTMVMALVARYPFALAPGMGLNAFFAFTVVIGMGHSWQYAMTAVLVEGLIFIVLSLFKVREKIFDAFPKSLRYAVSGGIGLFIAFIGLQNAKVVVPNASTGVSFFSFGANSFKSVGITVVLTIIGIIITGLLMHRKVKGGILIGILVTWGLGMLCQATGLYMPNAELGMYSVYPDFSGGIAAPSLAPTFCKFEWGEIFTLDFWVVVFSFLFVDVFDTMGTVIGAAVEGKMLDKEGKLPRIGRVFLADAIATVAGACFGTSTTTTYVESTSGIAVGGRTGLTSIVTGLLFLVALPLSPIFLAIPSFATAPALVIVGFLMMKSVLNIDFSNMREAIPGFICMAVMPFAYSISDGICMGIISYTAINTFARLISAIKVFFKVHYDQHEMDEIYHGPKVHWLLYVLSLLFILKYAFL